jgi:hypothetical protein
MNKVGWLMLMLFSFAGGYWLGLSINLMNRKSKTFDLEDFSEVLSLHTELTSPRCQCKNQNPKRKEE